MHAMRPGSVLGNAARRELQRKVRRVQLRPLPGGDGRLPPTVDRLLSSHGYHPESDTGCAYTMLQTADQTVFLHACSCMQRAVRSCRNHLVTYPSSQYCTVLEYMIQT
jgi:hypothetical protein